MNERASEPASQNERASEPVSQNERASEALAAEFDTIAAWTADVALDLGPDFHIPAGCRGSGSPAALTWLVNNLDLRAADRMLDCGAGVGGPSAFARERAGVEPILAEPAAGACRAARRLFGLPVIRADAGALPFATAVFDVAWCLGVLCTTGDQAGLLAELRRVLTPGGRLGLLVFTATATSLAVQPEGNNFPTPDELRALLREVGLAIETMAPAGAFGVEPPQWRARVDAVDAELERRHHDDEAWLTAKRQSATFGHLLASGQVSSSVLVARPSTARPLTDGPGPVSGPRRYRFLDGMGDVVEEHEFPGHAAALSWAGDDEDQELEIQRVEFRDDRGDWRWAGAIEGS